MLNLTSKLSGERLRGPVKTIVDLMLPDDTFYFRDELPVPLFGLYPATSFAVVDNADGREVFVPVEETITEDEYEEAMSGAPWNDDGLFPYLLGGEQ